MSSLLTPAAPGPEQQDAPLTEAERRLLVRLFSDPTYFPVEFRTWIRSYIEGSGIQLPASSIVGGQGKIVNLPAGIILPFAGVVQAPNVIPCDGRSLLRQDYLKLFQAIGTTWGAADATHFNVPDLRDRALYGAGNVIGLGATDGVAFGSRGGPRHHHAINLGTNGVGNHSHGVSVSGSGNFSGTTGAAGGHYHALDSPYDFAATSGVVAALGSGGTNRTLVSAAAYLTTSVGDHQHSFSGSVGVSSSGSTDAQGAHSHTVAGDSSGGYAQDVPSYAGITYVITTGV